MTDQLRESQDYEGIGQLSPEAEAAFSHQKGWDGLAQPTPQAEPGINQYQAHDISFWNRRANRQTLAVIDDDNFAADFFNPVNSRDDIPPRAGYGQGDGSYTTEPTAATDPVPFTGASPGTIAGADAAQERSGNMGVER